MQQQLNYRSASQARFPHRLCGTLILLLVITGCSICQPVAADSSGAPIRVGVLAHKGIDECKASWQPTIDYLNSAVPGYHFELVPLTFENITAATAGHDIDFVLSNPGIFADLEVNHGISQILTLNNFRRGHLLNEFGGVIIARKDRQDIRTYNDLKGKRIIAAGKNSFGGWYSGLRELKSHGIDPAKDFASLRFSESHPDAVQKVLSGEADAGIVRTDTLEQMEDEGKITLADVYVFPPDAQYQSPDFPLLYSTRLYPEWAFAKLPQTDDAVTSAVAIALLSVTPDSPSAKAAKIGGWISPVNYESVHDCLKDIRAPPYENYGVITLEDILRQYLYWIIAGVILIAALLIISLRLIMANRQLNTLRQTLEADITKRRQAEEALRLANLKLNLLSGITRHDIKNQLLALEGYLQISKKTLSDPARTAEFIANEIKIATTIARQINFTKDYEDLGVKAPIWQNVHSIISTVKQRLPMRDICMEAGDPALEIFADPLVEKVFYNLTDNALRYGGETMTCIRVSHRKENGNMVIVVEDDGNGISTKDKEKLFTKGFGKNTGLGLFLSREILSITGITITENGEPGKGARFEIVVPAGAYRFV